MNKEYEGALSPAMSKWNLLRGIMAIFIVLGHCSIEFTKEPLALVFFHKFNLVWVGVFFFLSGWGLFRSYDVKEAYLQGFIWKKTKKILIITFTVFLFELLLCCLYGGAIKNYENIVHFLLDYILSTNWYMWELLSFYFVFYVVKRVFKDEGKQLVTIFIFTVVLIVFAYYLLPKSYYISAFGFVCGCSTYIFRNEITRVFEKSKFSVAIGGILMGILCIVLSYLSDNPVLSILGRNGMCVVVCMLGTLGLMIVPWDFRFLKPLADVSLWIYLYQFPIIKTYRFVWAKQGREIDMTYVFVVVGTTLVLAFLIGSGLKLFAKCYKYLLSQKKI